MTDAELERIVSDFRSLGRSREDAELDRIEAALYLEDCLGIVLRDAEIRAVDPADGASMLRIARDGRRA